MSTTKSAFRPTSIDIAEYKRTVWQVTARSGSTEKDILDPMFWSHVSRKMKPYDIVEILEEEGKYWGRYLVLEVDDKWARLQQLEMHDLSKAAGADKSEMWSKLEDYAVTLRGPKLWSIVQKPDNTVVRDGFKTRKEAEAYRDSYIKSLAA